MRSLRFWTSAGLCLAPLLGLTASAARAQLTGTDPRTGLEPARVRPVAQVAKPQPAPAKKDDGGCHGTAVEFVDTPKEAAEQAKKEQKLVFVLHVSGHFEDPRFT